MDHHQAASVNPRPNQILCQIVTKARSQIKAKYLGTKALR
jgi:hypothetical protein